MDRALGNGMSFLDKGDPLQAINEFDHSLKIDPQNVQLLYDKALALVIASRFSEARAICDEQFALHPKMLRFLILKGKSYEREKNVTEAINTYNRALELDPFDTDLRLAVMQYALDNQQYDEVIQQASWFIRYKIELKEAYQALGSLEGKDSSYSLISEYLTKAT
ncbi:MAG: tetratricopeptide repeat protein [Sphaerochaetaceae bacterium]